MSTAQLHEDRNTLSHAHFSQCRALEHRASHAPACGSSLGCVARLRISTCFIDHSLMCSTHFLPFVPHHLRTTPTSLLMTGIRRFPCATPHGDKGVGGRLSHFVVPWHTSLQRLSSVVSSKRRGICHCSRHSSICHFSSSRVFQWRCATC